MIENSFEWYIDLFIFYILLINYATFMSQILFFESIRVQKTIVSFIYIFFLQKLYHFTLYYGNMDIIDFLLKNDNNVLKIIIIYNII